MASVEHHQTLFYALPAEIIHLILEEAVEIHYFPARRQPQGLGLVDYDPSRAISTSSRYIGDLRSISSVNRQLRLLCLPLLFRLTRCTSLGRLDDLRNECEVNSKFASFIRQLDVTRIDVPSSSISSVLSQLISHLTSLTRLDILSRALDTRLLAAANSHSTLSTVAVREWSSHGLSELDKLLASTDQSFSKILACRIPLVHRYAPSTVRSVAERGARFSFVSLHKLKWFINSAMEVPLPVLPGLERLDLSLEDSVRPWLLSFAQRHPNLQTISWTHWDFAYSSEAPDDTMLPFASKYISTNRQHPFNYQILLNSFSIARPASPWTSLNDWDVVQLELKPRSANLIHTPGVSLLETAVELAPQLHSLDLSLPDTRQLYAPEPMHIDDLIKFLKPAQFLRTLHLTNAYANLHYNGETPWVMPRPVKRGGRPVAPDPRGTSMCVVALDALRWYTMCIVKEMRSLELVHVTDVGKEGRGRFATKWTLEASFRIRFNEARDVEVIGTPKLEMGAKYLPKLGGR
ncbi:hypothetical protein R3P38DRAFT_818381 [Favolaschia claudopus]|uniref:F-box domain-containing protein n=1 Tax=Favolaschia claudopus TaxID=2862362 RepID=A0AAW0C1H5_9AGAR